MKTYHFYTTCVNIPHRYVDALNDMIDNGKEISYATMRKHCEGLDEIEKELGYDKHLRIKDDWHVVFCKSKFNGKPCYYLVWSAIEYVWVKGE